MSQQSRPTGVLLVAGAALCWSLGGPFVRLIERADDWTIAFWRAAIMAPLVLLALALMSRGRLGAAFARAGWRAWAAGACLAVMQIGYMLALARTTVANTMMFYALGPFVAALLGWSLLAERPAARVWLAMTIAFGGILIMVAGDLGRGEMLGNLFALMIALAGGSYAVTVRGAGNVNMMPAVVLGGIFCALASLGFAQPFAVSSHDFVLMALLGAVQLALPTTLYVFGARHLPAAEITLIALLEAVLGPIWVWLFMNEIPSTHALLGGLVVLAAVTMLTLATARVNGRLTRPTPASTPPPPA